MPKMTKREASAKLSELVSQFESALSQAESLADEYGLEFSIEPSYGMGGTYVGKALLEDEDSWYSSDDEYGWMSSSQSC